MKKPFILQTVSILNRGKLQACRIIVAGFLYACFPSISGHAAPRGQTVIECLSPLKVDTTRTGRMAAFLFNDVFKGMVSTKNNRLRAKRSNPKTTSTARHAVLDKIISRHFQTWGLTGTIEPLQRLQDFYLTYAFERGIKPVFVADVAFKAALITKLICGLYENKEGGKNE